MPIDRTMSVSLSDTTRRPIVTFRRAGGQVFVDTVTDGVVREHPVTPAELSQLASFLGDLATTRWSDDTPAAAPAAQPAPTAPPAPATAEPATTRTTSLPPYPHSARWVPTPNGGQRSASDGGRD